MNNIFCFSLQLTFYKKDWKKVSFRGNTRNQGETFMKQSELEIKYQYETSWPT